MLMLNRYFRIRISIVVSSVLSGMILCQPAIAQDAAAVFAAFEQSVVDVVSRAERSVVAVARIPLRTERIDRQPARRPFGPRALNGNDPLSPEFAPQEFGAGILMSQPGNPDSRFVLTNYHVVAGGRPFLNDGTVTSDARLTVRIDQTRAAWASIYAADPRSDLAVLAIDNENFTKALKERPVLSIPESVTIRKGQFVLSLGNPYAIARDGSPSVSQGMISNVSRVPLFKASRDEQTLHEFGTLLHVDTRLGPGASGGALLNSTGQLIGITTSLAALEGYESTVGYAIPLHGQMKRIVDELLNGYEVEYGFLGVQPAGLAMDGFRNSPRAQVLGVRVGSVVPDSPAHRAGLRQQEFIRAVNGVRLFSYRDLFREIGLLEPGTNAHLHVVGRNGQRFVDVKIAKWPVRIPDRIIVAKYRQTPWRGLRVDWPAARLKFFDAEAPYPLAVVVKTVEPNSPAEAAGLRPGDLIHRVAGRAVETPQEFTRAVKALQGNVRLELAEGKTATIQP